MNLLQDVGKVLDHNDRPRARIHQLVLKFPRCVHGIGVDHDQAGLERSEHRHRILQDIGHHHRNAVALGQSLALQPGRKMTGLLLQFTVAQFLYRN